jgi:ATP-dependent DNA helicase RecG
MKIEDKKNLYSPVQYVKSIGPKRAESFNKIGIKTVRDLLFYFPYKHLDRSTTVNSSKAYNYVLNGYEGEFTIIAKVYDTEIFRAGRKEILKVQFKDSNGFFEAMWFQGIKYYQKIFEEGEIYAISGKGVISKYGQLQFAHPDFDKISEDESLNFLNTGKIIPFYTLPKELKNMRIGELSLRKIIHYAVENYLSLFDETLPQEIIKKNNLISIQDAIRNYHFPETHQHLAAAIHRMKFEELFYIEIIVAMKKRNYKTVLKGNSLKVRSKLVQEFLTTLPFSFTNAQLGVLHEIRKDMEEEKPMNRLLQGDVGSGKTIVALTAILIAVDAGFQAVLMAPTEILADQHFKTISSYLNKITLRDITISILLGGQKKSVREKLLNDIETNKTDIVVGTHALFEEKVVFNKLGLIIIDEQHRFGVVQRSKLISKGNTPDVIVMSATPIPRTLSMTVYGDLDVSIIDEMPENRIPVKTVIRGEGKLPEIYKFIIDKIKDDYQSFVVFPLVEESEKLELKAAETYFKSLTETFFKNINVGLLHGRMSWQEKEEVMHQFLNKKYNALISTTVIEVGIDIPDANIIVINNAERFGLSQLHQLRGRVGRGTKQAYCILVVKDEFAASLSRKNINVEFLSSAQIEKQKTSVRLKSMIKYNDGFKIAEIDLKLRGPGNIFGIEQSGFPELKYSDISKDAEVISAAKIEAFRIIDEDPHLSSAVNKIIKHNLLQHYSDNLNYAKIA